MVTVRPRSSEDVTVSLPETTDCDATGAVCIEDGRPLSNSNSATVAGPAGISVADARVEEGAGAVLAFTVTLSRAATSTLSVDYATSDGSAQAGADYTAASGTLTFEAGDSSGTIEVGVLDDALDEGEETLTLRSVEPVGRRAGGWRGDGDDRERGPDAGRAAGALRARDGRGSFSSATTRSRFATAFPCPRGCRQRVPVPTAKPPKSSTLQVTFAFRA